MRVFGYSGPQSGQKRFGQTSVKLGQLRSNLVKFREMCPRLLLEVILTWWALVGSSWLDLGCLVLRDDTLENPEGRNVVMTLGIGLDRRC